MIENIIQDTAKAHKDFKYIIFRYFNVAGADIHYKDKKLTPRIGESFDDYIHLIKIASQCATKKRQNVYLWR